MTTETTAVDMADGPRRGTTNCGFCGQAWFGDVAYCPYCGHRSASAPAGTGAQAPAAPASQAVAPAHAGGPQREGVPQGPDDPAPASQAAVPPALKPPGSAAPPSAADEGVTEALADSVQSYTGTMRLFGAPAEAQAAPPRMRWKARWKPIVTAAAALAVVAIAVQQLSVTTRDRAGPPSVKRAPAPGAAGNTSEAGNRVTAPRAAPPPAPATATAPPPAPAAVNAAAAVTAPVAPNGGVPPNTAQAPRAEPVKQPSADSAPPQQPRAAAPAAPRRSLCSAASEAAGLCNPQ